MLFCPPACRIPQLLCGCSIWTLRVAEVRQMEKHIWDLSAQFGLDTNIRVFKGMFLFWATAESPSQVSVRWLTRTVFCYVAINRKFQILYMLNPARSADTGLFICLKAKVQVYQTTALGQERALSDPPRQGKFCCSIWYKLFTCLQMLMLWQTILSHLSLTLSQL